MMEDLDLNHIGNVRIASEEPGRFIHSFDKHLYHKASADGSNDNELVYLSSLQHILSNGVAKPDRTGTGTLSAFGPQCVYDLRKGFPLLTTKKMAWNSIIQELWWFLRGQTNNNLLNEVGVRIWDDWANEDGELGPVYGQMWRAYPGVAGGISNGEPTDQLSVLIDDLVHDKFSRRMIVDSWHPSLLPISGLPHPENIRAGKQVLPPCHCLWQMNVEEIPLKERIEISGKEGITYCTGNSVTAQVTWLNNHSIPKYYIDLKLYQRSGDIFLGVPFNIASYSALLVLLGYLTGYIPRYFIHTFGDLHLYSNHIEQAHLQLDRIPKAAPKLYTGISFPSMEGDSEGTMANLQFLLDNSNLALMLNSYDSHGAISAPISV